MRRPAPAKCDGERGLTVIELMITLAVMGAMVAATLSVLFSAYDQTGVVLNRRDVLGDGQIAMQQMTKQFRQATEINASSDTLLDVDTFTGAGDSHRIVWQTTGSAAPYTLQVSTDGGDPKTVLSSLASPSLFTYSDPDTDLIVNQVTIRLSLGTSTSTVILTSDVELRNL